MTEMDSTRIRKCYETVKNFLLSHKNKEFLIFLFFFFVSAAFWLLQSLNEDFDVELKVPLNLEHVPADVVITSELPDDLNVVVRDKISEPVEQLVVDDDGTVIDRVSANRVVLSTESIKTTQTTIPFVKDNEFDYAWFTGGNRVATWILYVLVAIFVVTAVSNGANLTDGLDGLVSGVSVPIVAVLGILAYLSGHIVYADYLNIMYIPGSGELVVFAAAFAGALIGFLWYNSFPAQTFMGDTGSLAIGGIIAVFALCIRKELLLPILCGIFLVESVSVMLQVSYFKYTKRRFGEGRRLFLMAPIHHHYQKKGLFETKIVTRFWIISLLLSLAALATLKIR